MTDRQVSLSSNSITVLAPLIGTIFLLASLILSVVFARATAHERADRRRPSTTADASCESQPRVRRQ